MSYYTEILTPMLELAGIDHEMIKTTSGDFISSWLNELDIDSFPYTDFILLGGDGMFNQLLNAIFKHPEKERLIKIPIGIMPWGSQNAISWDLGCKDPYQAAIKIIRGQSVKGDIMKVKFEGSKEYVYGTSLIWGFPSHIVSQGQKWRSIFKSMRYWAWAVRNFIWTWTFMRYQWKIQYKWESLLNCKIETRNKLLCDEKSLYISKDTWDIDKNHFMKINNIPNKISFKENKLSQNSISQSKWIGLDTTDFFFFVVLTHEARSSLSNETFLPFARINDSKMYLWSIERLSKVNSLIFLKNLQSSKHINMDEFYVREVTEVKVSPHSDMFFTIDGEVYPWDKTKIQSMPSAVTLIGEPYQVTSEWEDKGRVLTHKSIA